MARVRSPNYPIISLPEAIDRVRKVYDKEHLHKASPEVVCKAMGYNGANGSSLGILSALKKYLLLEEVGKDLKVSQDALTILVDPPSSSVRAAMVRKTALAPALFAALHEEFGELPPSDENLRAYLLKRGFAQSAVDTPIRTYRETLEFVSRLGAPYNTQETKEVDETGESMEVAADRGQQAAVRLDAPPLTGVKRDVWDLDEGRVVLERPANLGPDSLEYLEAWLTLLLRKIKKEKPELPPAA